MAVFLLTLTGLVIFALLLAIGPMRNRPIRPGCAVPASDPCECEASRHCTARKEGP